MVEPAGLFAALALAAVPGAAAGVDGPAGIAAGVRACINAVTATGIDDVGLLRDGWSSYDVEAGDPDLPLRLYGRGRGPLLLTGVGADAKESGCHVIAPRSAPIGFDEAVVGLTAELRAAPGERKPAEATWVMGDKVVMLETVKTTAKTTVRATIVSLAEGTK